MTEVQGRLRRELGVFGATMMGLGAMVGTGVFVSIGIAAGAAGPAVLLAIALAALVATCNALSSAQLAASMPVSGGTYEYGNRYLNHWLGFTAGWMFLCAKTASAATAALGFAGYLLRLLNAPGPTVAVAVATALAMTLIVVSGIRLSSRANVAIVSVTLAALLFFIIGGAGLASAGGRSLVPFFPSSSGHLFHAAALMFVAFTGYARIATLGEEVREPRRTIPRAIILTLVVSSLLYVGVGAVGIALVGPETLAQAARTEIAPLAVVARQFDLAGAATIISIGAMTAMLGVLLNLLLGLSRVLLAMGRHGDAPPIFSRIAAFGSPVSAVAAVGIVVAALALLGDVTVTWSFSAFTVLIYYAITNLAALRLPTARRLFSPLIAWAGLLSCLFLAFWVEPSIWLTGVGLIGTGLIWHMVARRIWPARSAVGTGSGDGGAGQ